LTALTISSEIDMAELIAFLIGVVVGVCLGFCVGMLACVLLQLREQRRLRTNPHQSETPQGLGAVPDKQCT
jgi:NhaP-type Na+/H+ or K+/H+ antiporter